MAVAQLYYYVAPKNEIQIVAKSLIRLLRSYRQAIKQHQIETKIVCLIIIVKFKRGSNNSLKKYRFNGTEEPAVVPDAPEELLCAFERQHSSENTQA